MKLSKTSAHAAVAVAFLASRSSEAANSQPIQARQIAEHLKIPTDSALKILQCLVRHRIIQSQLGRSGGYFLNRDPQEVTLLQIIEAVDGPIVGDVPLHDGTRTVRMLGKICNRIADQLREDLGQQTVAELAGMNGPASLAVAG